MALLWLQQLSECVSICIFAVKINFSSIDQSLLPDPELNFNPSKIQWIICIGCADQSVIDVLKRKLIIHNTLQYWQGTF